MEPQQNYLGVLCPINKINKNVALRDEIIVFVDEKFPQYRMKFFRINKFLYRNNDSKVILEILENE